MKHLQPLSVLPSEMVMELNNGRDQKQDDDTDI